MNLMNLSGTAEIISMLSLQVTHYMELRSTEVKTHMLFFYNLLNLSFSSAHIRDALI